VVKIFDDLHIRAIAIGVDRRAEGIDRVDDVVIFLAFVEKLRGEVNHIGAMTMGNEVDDGVDRIASD